MLYLGWRGQQSNCDSWYWKLVCKLIYIAYFYEIQVDLFHPVPRWEKTSCFLWVNTGCPQSWDSYSACVDVLTCEHNLLENVFSVNNRGAFCILIKTLGMLWEPGVIQWLWTSLTVEVFKESDLRFVTGLGLVGGLWTMSLQMTICEEGFNFLGKHLLWVSFQTRLVKATWSEWSTGLALSRRLGSSSSFQPEGFCPLVYFLQEVFVPHSHHQL